MKEMPIDRLLEWAYGYELLKNPSLLAPGTLQSVYGKVLRFGQYGCKPSDGGGDWPWLPDFEGPPHVDALKIDAAVVALQPQRVEWPAAKAELMGDLAEITPDDHSQLRLNSTDLDGLIITCASLRRPPDWGDDRPEPKRVVVGRNSVMVMGGLARDRRSYRTGSYCPLRWEPDPVSIARARIEYAAWHGTLLKLAADLNRQMEAHRALPPAAPGRPWAGERIAERRILASMPVCA